MAESSSYKPQVFIDLEAGSEWRFELEGDENIAVRVSGVFPALQCTLHGSRIRERMGNLGCMCLVSR